MCTCMELRLNTFLYGQGLADMTLAGYWLQNGTILEHPAHSNKQQFLMSLCSSTQEFSPLTRSAFIDIPHG